MLTTSNVLGRDTGERLIELIDKIGDDLASQMLVLSAAEGLQISFCRAPLSRLLESNFLWRCWDALWFLLSL